MANSNMETEQAAPNGFGRWMVATLDIHPISRDKGKLAATTQE